MRNSLLLHFIEIRNQTRTHNRVTKKRTNDCVLRGRKKDQIPRYQENVREKKIQQQAIKWKNIIPYFRFEERVAEDFIKNNDMNCAFSPAVGPPSSARHRRKTTPFSIRGGVILTSLVYDPWTNGVRKEVDVWLISFSLFFPSFRSDAAACRARIQRVVFLIYNSERKMRYCGRLSVDAAQQSLVCGNLRKWQNAQMWYIHINYYSVLRGSTFEKKTINNKAWFTIRKIIIFREVFANFAPKVYAEKFFTHYILRLWLFIFIWKSK